MRIKTDILDQVASGVFDMSALMAKHAIPGCTLACAPGGAMTFSSAWGVRNEQGTPMTEGVLFECASLTKSLFALLAMQEVQLGKLDLDAPIAPLLRDQSWSNDPRFLTITPRHCLSHGCGLPNWQTKPMEMKFDPGTAYSYSGEGYFLLQRLVEQIENKDMNTLFRERFFSKYAMESSTAFWTPAVGAAFSQGFDKEGRVCKVRSSRRLSGNAPEPNAAWSLYSYAADYLRFLCGMMAGRGGLRDELFEQMTTAHNRADDHIDWGLGFGIVHDAPSVLWHWGDNDGFKSFAVWDKQTRDAVVVTTNSDHGMAFYFDLLKMLTDGDFYDHICAFIEGAE